MTRTMTLEDAVERYLKERRKNVAESTLYNHSSQLHQFIKWCAKEDIEKVGEVDQWAVADFRVARQKDLKQVTLYNQMSMLRVFIKWCESRGLLEDISENIIMPDVDDDSSNEMLTPERGEKLLDELQKYDYASLQHVCFALIWTTGMRIGATLSLDVQDYHSDEKYIELHHRPDTDTPLKNGSSSERHINLHEWVCTTVDDYIEDRRLEVADDYGRQPLLTTKHGRIHQNTLRKRIRSLTRPCELTNNCPYDDRDIATCEATEYSKAAQCPGSVSPHPLRRSAITNYLNEGHSKRLVSDRMDVSVDVLETHYDARSKDEKREVRREMFDMS